MPGKAKAVFLDRDGVLIHDVHYLSKLNQIKLYPDVPQGLLQLKNAGYHLALVTNQSGVARGYFTDYFVNQAHDLLNRMLSQSGIQLDAVYYCPHHIEGIAPYNIQCQCRKPQPGMINKAKEEFNIDCSRSFVIGDKMCDIELAENVGASGVLVQTGHGARDSKVVLEKYPQTPIFETFSKAVNYIIQQ